MKTCKPAVKTYAGLTLLLVSMLVLAGCGSSDVDSETAENVPGDTQLPIDSNADLTALLEIPGQLAVGEKVDLKFTLTNTSETPMYVLKWYTPLEGIAGEIFRVVRDGQMVPYEGIMASRGAPTHDEYIFLGVGESVSAVVDLSTAFDFSKAGTYEVRFISPRISHIALSEDEMATSVDDLRPVEMASNPVSVKIGK